MTFTLCAHLRELKMSHKIMKEELWAMPGSGCTKVRHRFGTEVVPAQLASTH